MSLGKHALIGIGAGAILYPFLGINTLWFLAASVLIDIDHCISFILLTRFTDFNLKTMFKYFNILLSWKHRNEMLGINVFHTLEFLGLVSICAYIFNSQALFMVSLGFMFHLVCDFIFLIRRGILFRRANSFLEYFIRRHHMKKMGINIDQVFLDAIKIARPN